MEVPQIIGADISKKTIDFACSVTQKSLRISNDEDGFKTLDTWISEQGIDRSRMRVVMEHTGGYSYRSRAVFVQQKPALCQSLRPGHQAVHGPGPR